MEVDQKSLNTPRRSGNVKEVRAIFELQPNLAVDVQRHVHPWQPAAEHRGAKAPNGRGASGELVTQADFQVSEQKGKNIFETMQENGLASPVFITKHDESILTLVSSRLVGHDDTEDYSLTNVRLELESHDEEDDRSEAAGASPRSSVTEEVERWSARDSEHMASNVLRLEAMSDASEASSLFYFAPRYIGHRSHFFSRFWVPLYKNPDGTTWTTLLLQGPYASIAGVAVYSAQAMHKLIGSAARDLPDRPVTQVIVASACGGAVATGTAGAVVGSAAGGTVGIMAGLLVAPLTFGLSIPIGAAVGSCTGLCAGAAGGTAAGAAGGGLLGYSCCLYLGISSTSKEHT